MGVEFVTFDNAVNTMPRILRRCGLYGCTQKLFMSFLLPADYRPCGLSCGNYGTQIKGAFDNILKLSFWLNFIYQVKIDCYFTNSNSF